MPKIILDNWLGGIAPSERMGAAGSYYQGNSINPIADIGYLTAGAKAQAVDNSGDAVPLVAASINAATVDAANGDVYLMERGAKLHQYDIVTTTLVGAGSFPHSITNAIGEDVIIYPVGSTQYLFYSWSDGTDGDVGRYDLSSTFDDDYMSTVPASGAALLKTVPHKMMEWSENGNLYITNGRNLVEFDGQTGANGTMDATKFQLPVGWVMTDLFNAGEYIGITAVFNTAATWSWTGRRTRAAVFFWDGVSTKWVKKVDVADAEIRAAQNINGVYRIFGRSAKGEGTIRDWDGNRFKLKQIIRPYYSAAAADRRYVEGYGCVDELNGLSIFTGTNGGVGKGEIFMYGSIEPGMPEALYQVSQAETVTQTQGWGIVVTNNEVLFSMYDQGNTTYYISKFSHSAWATDDPKMVYKSLYLDFPYRIKINFVKLLFKPLVSGNDDDIQIETDYGNATTTLGSVSFAIDTAVESKRFNNKIICNAFRVIIDTDDSNGNGGINYSKIIVDYEPYDDV